MNNTISLTTSAGETLVTYRTAGSITLIVSATVNGADVRDLLSEEDVESIESAMTNAAAATAAAQPDPSAEDIVANARAFCAEVAAVIEANYRQVCPNMVAAGIMDSARIELGRKYAKIVRTEIRDGKSADRSVFGFIDLTTGNILKAASWAKPAAGARGNVLDVEGRRKSFTPYGINRRR